MKYNEIIKKMDFEYFGKGKHQIAPGKIINEENSLLLDVRCREEVESLSFGLKHHVEVLEIPLHELPERMNEIPKDRSIGVFCSSGTRSVMAFFYLLANGFEKVRILEGGYAELAAELKPGKLWKRMEGNRG